MCVGGGGEALFCHGVVKLGGNVLITAGVIFPHPMKEIICSRRKICLCEGGMVRQPGKYGFISWIQLSLKPFHLWSLITGANKFLYTASVSWSWISLITESL